MEEEERELRLSEGSSVGLELALHQETHEGPIVYSWLKVAETASKQVGAKTQTGCKTFMQHLKAKDKM